MSFFIQETNKINHQSRIKGRNIDRYEERYPLEEYTKSDTFSKYKIPGFFRLSKEERQSFCQLFKPPRLVKIIIIVPALG